MSGRQNVTCKANGRWTSIPSCDPIQCARPRIIPNGYIQVAQSLTVGNNITYHCVPGYMLVGQSHRSCLETRMWGGDEPRCQPISCGEPPDVEHASRNGDDFTYGESVSYMCEMGYAQHGAVTISCTESGAWSPGPPVCIPILCPPLPVLHHGVVIGDLFHYGKLVQIECNFGYILRGVSELTCTIYGRWSAKPPQCEPVFCGRPEIGEHSSYRGNQFSFGDVVRYNCRPGYNLIGEKQRICDGTGQWIPAVPRCEPMQCASPPHVPNSRITQPLDDNFVFGIIVVYQCIDGYEMQEDEGIIFCHSDGQWRGLLPVCEKVICGTVRGIAHGTVVTTGEAYSDTASYQCDEGYELQGFELRTCQANGNWSGDTPVCIPITCVEPPTVQHATISGDRYFSRKILYSCDPGYEIVGNTVLKCGADGQWIGIVPECRIVSCGLPPDISHGTPVGVQFTFNSSIVYHCSNGYHLIGNSVLKCTELALWEGDLPECHPVLCDPPPSIRNSELIGADLSYNHNITFHCKPGYYLEGNPTVRCSQDAEWIGDFPQCKPVSCKEPPSVSNARYGAENMTYGSTVTYTCMEGYIPAGNAELQCSKNGTWSGIMPGCEPVSCGPPPVILHGSISDLVEFTFNKSESYKCDFGYVLQDGVNGFIKCSASGVWIGDIPECEPVSCGPPDPIQHGHTVGDIYTYTHTIQHQCNIGYDLYGNGIATCSGDSRWEFESQLPPQCIPVQCGPPQEIPNATWNEVDTVYKATVTYSCMEGFVMNGTAEIVCQHDATWHGRLPECHPVVCDDPLPPEHGWFGGSIFTYGSGVEYFCHLGYHLNGRSSFGSLFIYHFAMI